MAGEPAGDFHGVGEGRGARGRDTAMCGTSPDRDHEDSGDDDDDDVDGDDDSDLGTFVLIERLTLNIGWTLVGRSQDMDIKLEMVNLELFF